MLIIFFFNKLYFFYSSPPYNREIKNRKLIKGGLKSERKRKKRFCEKIWIVGKRKKKFGKINEKVLIGISKTFTAAKRDNKKRG